MGKFGRTGQPLIAGPLGVTETETVTYEGAPAHVRDAKSELFLLAVSNMVGEQTFYEGAQDRDQRFVKLVHQVTVEDPKWMQSFLPYLRDTMQMRSASVVAAIEYVKAGGPEGRFVVSSAMSRADEPTEALAYWTQRYGRKLPKPIKRGVADAITRLYNEYSATKYDRADHAWRPGDAIELVHPKPKADWQGDLFRYLIDARHGHVDERTSFERLPALALRKELYELDVAERRTVLRHTPERLKEAGLTWEALSGWLQGPMDAEAWQSIIPSMGYMALLRNLRNFESAGVEPSILKAVSDKLRDPAEVAKSRQFPIRFLSAWKASQSMTFGLALEQALELSLSNVPRLPGRTLVLIDCSGSMSGTLSARSTVTRREAAGVFGLALAKRSEAGMTWLYGTQWGELRMNPSASVLRMVQELPDLGGTNTFGALQAILGSHPHDRVVLLTDEQAHSSYSNWRPSVPVYCFNLAGYRPTIEKPNDPLWTTFGGGLTDAGFRALGVLTSRRDASWPWEATA